MRRFQETFLEKGMTIVSRLLTIYSKTVEIEGKHTHTGEKGHLKTFQLIFYCSPSNG